MTTLTLYHTTWMSDRTVLANVEPPLKRAAFEQIRIVCAVRPGLDAATISRDFSPLAAWNTGLNNGDPMHTLYTFISDNAVTLTEEMQTLGLVDRVCS